MCSLLIGGTQASLSYIWSLLVPRYYNTVEFKSEANLRVKSAVWDWHPIQRLFRTEKCRACAENRYIHRKESDPQGVSSFMLAIVFGISAADFVVTRQTSGYADAICVGESDKLRKRCHTPGCFSLFPSCFLSLVVSFSSFFFFFFPCSFLKSFPFVQPDTMNDLNLRSIQRLFLRLSYSTPLCKNPNGKSLPPYWIFPTLHHTCFY